MSNFDPNAILRGAQLTLVGGKWSGGSFEGFEADTSKSQHTAPSKIQNSLPQITTVKLL